MWHPLYGKPISRKSKKGRGLQRVISCRQMRASCLLPCDPIAIEEPADSGETYLNALILSDEVTEVFERRRRVGCDQLLDGFSRELLMDGNRSVRQILA